MNHIPTFFSDERLARDARQRLYSDWFLKNCPSMIFLFDEALRLIACSEACAALLRDPVIERLKRTPLKDIFAAGMDGGWIQILYEHNKGALTTLSRRQFDGALALRGKDPMHAQVTVSPILDEDGNCHGTITIMSDITELMETKRRAEEAARSKSSFLANMSHEIRTPMNAVKGLSELLAMTELSALQRNYVKNIISSANSLLGIINDVLDFSKIDADKIDFIEGPYDLAGLITGVCNVVSIRAEDKNLLLMIDAAPGLPATLSGDDVRIKQVLTNLLSNAVKYTNEGYVRLRVRSEDRDGATWLSFTVEDSGIGIRERDIPTLFDAFARADLIANRSIAGTGLGLSISKRLALAMGGDILVASEYGKGSAFTFLVPQKVVDARPIAHIETPGDRRALLLGEGERMRNLADMLHSLGVAHTQMEARAFQGGDEWPGYTHCIYDGSIPERVIRLLRGRMPDCLFAPLKDMRHAMSVSDYQDTVLYLPVFIADLARFIDRRDRDDKIRLSPEPDGEEISLTGACALVVDDNEINRVVSGEILRTFGAGIVCAESGDEAIRLCEEQKFDIIFMDHMMPGKDGIETTAEIRNGRGPNSATPIVALTANVVNDMERIYLSSGMDDFVGKPIEISDISRVLRKWLPKDKVRERTAARGPDAGGIRSELLSPEDLIAAFDNFGLYSSDVLREMNGDFDGYITRMEAASKVLDGLVTRLKAEVSAARWDEFSNDCLELRSLLYGIGARDCAGRARKLAIAARERNIDYIHEDFFSLMGNMYMLDKKLVVIVPFARGDNARDLPLASAQYLHGCLEKMRRALMEGNAVEAMAELESAAAFSLDMDLDMALKAIKGDLEKGDFGAALEHHAAIFKAYTERMAKL